jgi:MoxR-like ATPase
MADVEAATDAAELLSVMDVVDGVHVEPDVASYIVEIVARTRRDESVVLGASARASMALGAASRAAAAMDGRDFVIPDDVKSLVGPVLGHRIVLQPDARLRRLTPAKVLTAIVESIDLD